MGKLETTGVENAPVRWPSALGIAGIVVAALMFVDKIDDLLALLLMSPETWSRWLGADAAEVVVRLLPPIGWVVVAAVIGVALAVVLFVGSLRLRHRLRSGIELCRRWSQMTIAWAVIEISAASWWLQRNAEVLSDLANSEWQGAATLGVLVALAVMIAFPVFVLVFLARPAVRREYATWPAG